MHLAGLLAAEGFSCLALGYFKVAGLPRRLVEVPLEYVETALGWLREQPQVCGRRVGVVGSSKGAELALLSASMFPDAIGAVVPYAPSSVAFAGIAVGGDGRRRSSWSYRNSPLPFVPYPPRVRPTLGARGLSLAPMYRAALDNTEAVAAATIPIERSDAPILLISGGRDRMWPSSTMADMITARLAQAGKNDQVTHRRYPDAGHSFMPWAPNIRSKLGRRIVNQMRLTGLGAPFELGGRPRANRDALHDAWPKVIAFLTENLS